ncbi:MAG: hypothetical protein ABJC13_07465 [Acidobacteriota bacterium]
MKMTIIVDAAGRVVGATQSVAIAKGAKASTIEAGVVADPGQSVHEVEVSDEVAHLAGPDLLERLAGEGGLKKALKSLVTAGQA